MATTRSTSTGSTDPPPIAENSPADPDQIEPTTSCLSLDNARVLDMIEISYGLLDVLLSRGVLTQQQVHHIHSDANITGQIRRLLDEVKKLSHEQQEQFLSALDETQQSHVTNYIRHNGKRPTAVTDDWPLFEFDQHKNIERNRSELIEMIDSRHGLLDRLRSVQCINKRQEQVIVSKQSVMADSNEILLYVIMRKSLKDFTNFVDCLLKSKQQHVVSLLEPRLAKNSQPVSEQNKSALTKHYATLVKLIGSKHSGLVDELIAEDVIMWQQKEYIESATTQSKCNRRILEIVERGSQSGFDKFIECLGKTGHQNVVDLFSGEGAVTTMVAQTSGSGNLADHEIRAVEQFKHVLANTSHRQLILEMLESHGIQLIAMTTEHSIKLFYVCSSLSALMKLNEFYISGQLKDIIQRILAYLLENKYHISVDRLVWEMSDYCECAHHLFNAHGLSINSHIHQLALQRPDVGGSEHSTSQQPLLELPHELIEQLLLKAAGQLFVGMKNTTARAHALALSMLQSVCEYWRETLTSRQRNRQLLRRYFKHVCIPYRFDPKLVTKLRIEDGSITVGIAELNNKLYVATSASNRIQAFSAAQLCSSKLGEDIVLPHLRRPLDMVACNKTNCLYISDIETLCIWRVTVTPLSVEKAVDKWIKTDYVPWTLSLQTNRLAVTARDGPAMYVYSCEDGTLVRNVNQPSYMFARHSIETLDGTAIVCHRNWIGDEDPGHRPGASELNKDGQVLRRYQGAVELDQPYYLTMDSKQHILVCDRHKKDVAHLNRELKLEQVVLTRRELSGQPQRLCYNEQRGLLYVSYSDLPQIDVYRI